MLFFIEDLNFQTFAPFQTDTPGQPFDHLRYKNSSTADLSFAKYFKIYFNHEKPVLISVLTS